MMEPLVSIIMNCLNGAQYIHEALQSILAQTYQSWEVIFWDNGSSDGSGSIAKSYGPKIRYFRNETTTPLSTARNHAISKCRGDYVAILDVDDIWLPNKLEKQ